MPDNAGWPRHLSWPLKRQNTEFIGEIAFQQREFGWSARVVCKDLRYFEACGETRAEAARRLLEMVATNSKAPLAADART